MGLMGLEKFKDQRPGDPDPGVACAGTSLPITSEILDAREGVGRKGSSPDDGSIS